jgi:hypothetical protein
VACWREILFRTVLGMQRAAGNEQAKCRDTFEDPAQVAQLPKRGVRMILTSLAGIGTTSSHQRLFHSREIAFCRCTIQGE